MTIPTTSFGRADVLVLPDLVVGVMAVGLLLAFLGWPVAVKVLKKAINSTDEANRIMNKNVGTR